MPFTFNFGGFNPGDFGQGGERPQRERKPRKPIGTPVTRTLINIAVTALVGLVYFYVELPALNPHAEEFYFFVFLLCAVYCGCAVLTSGFQGTGARGYLGLVHHTLLRGDRHDRRHRHRFPHIMGGAAGRGIQQAAALDHR